MRSSTHVMSFADLPLDCISFGIVPFLRVPDLHELFQTCSLSHEALEKYAKWISSNPQQILEAIRSNYGLNQACEKGYYSAAQFGLEHGEIADVNCFNNALQSQNRDLIYLILRRLDDLEDYEVCFIEKDLIVDLNDFDITQVFFLDFLRVRNRDLLRAAINGKTEFLKALCEMEQSVDEECLVKAAENGHLETVSMLIDYKKNYSLREALNAAVDNKHRDVAIALVKQMC